MKACTKCGESKTLDAFNKQGSSRDGFKSRCRACQADDNRLRYASDPERFKSATADYQRANREVVLANKRAHYHVNRAEIAEKQAAYARANRAHRTAYRRAYAQANPGREREWARNYRQRYPERHAAAAAVRNAAKLRAIPAWADLDAIEAIYALARQWSLRDGFAWHVDHEIPLRSPVVCGFHCETNLQILPGFINIQKSNRYWPGTLL